MKPKNFGAQLIQYYLKSLHSHSIRTFTQSSNMPGEINPTKMQVCKLSEHALVPTKGSKLAAGYDLYSAYDYVIPAQGKVIAKTDISIRVPDGTYGRIAPRSGLSAKHHIDVGAGVVDQDYTGNVGVVLFNHAQAEFEIKKGDRIAQLVCEKIEYPEIEEVTSLNSTDRGEGGFGSTGSN
eukprot:06987.XXX_116498_117091_1 [CDS] Oithona nana genome sequencing.